MRTLRLATLAVSAVLLCSGAAQQKPTVKTVDDLWLDAQRNATTTSAGRTREDVTVYERFLSAHKDYVPAMLAIARHYQLAADEITDRSAKSVATRTRHLETAAAHYRRAVEVTTEPVDAVMALVGLLRVLDPSNLNRMADAAPVARAAVKKHPDNAGVVAGMLQTMLPTPESALDAATFRSVRELVPSTPGAQYALAMHLFNLERHVGKGALPRESARKLMTEAVAAIDAALKIRPNDYESLMFKAMVLKAQADRVEQDPARKKALAAEAARLTALAEKSRSTAIAQERPAWQDAVVQAMDLHAQGKIPDAIAVLRKARTATPALPPIHVLQLAQYLTEHVMQSPTMPPADARRFLDEARTLTDELIKKKQEVSTAMRAKSMVLKEQADRVETDPARRKSLTAESDRLFSEARFVNADGSPIPKTVDDEWSEIQRLAFVGDAPGKEREDVAAYERFLKSHPDYTPALRAIGDYYLRRAEEITDQSAKSVATRTRHLETAVSHLRRATEVATKPEEAAMAYWGLLRALDPAHLNRTTEAAALARAAVKKYPNDVTLVIPLLETIIPSAAAVNASTIRAAREAMPATAEAWHTYGIFFFHLERPQSAKLPRDQSRVLLAEAVAGHDAALKIKPDFGDAMLYKAVVLKAQAERIEQDPARRKALIAEADRLIAQAGKLKKF